MPDSKTNIDTDLQVMTRLYEVGATCARVGNDFGACLDTILGAAIELAGAQRGMLRLVDRRTQQFEVSASRGWTRESAASWATTMLGEAAGGVLATLRARERVVAADIERDAGPIGEAMRAVCLAETVLAAQWTPLISGRGQLLAVLEVHFSAPRMPSRSELRASDLLARQAADYLERRQMESDIKASEERFRDFTSATSDIIYRMSGDWTRLCQLQGRRLIVGTFEPTSDWLNQYVPADERERVQRAIRRAVESTSVFELEHRVLRLDGSTGWIHSRAIPIVDDNGRITEWFGTASDVTQQREAEKALLASEARYRTLFESIDEGYCIIRVLLDDAGRGYDYVFEEVNQSFERQTGLKGVEGRSMRSLAPDHEAHWYEVYGQIAVTGESQRFEHAATALHRWYDVYAYRIGEPEERRVAVLFQDIYDRKRAEQALTEANRNKDVFLATLAHELRNPLAPIRTGLDILKLSGGSSAETSSVLPMLERQVSHMVHLVDDLLEVSRISRGTIALRKQRVDLGTVLHNAVETSQPLIDAAHHQFSMESPGQTLFVDGDPTRLTQVIANLLNNAARYTNVGGRIELSARRDNESAVVTIRDNGIGIPQAMLSKIFDWFTQAERTHDGAQGGLGVGLTLVRTLVEMHGGTVVAHSEGPGHGAEFIVRLPLADADDRTELKAARSASHKPLVSRILVVDDNRDAAHSLCLLLQLSGAHVKALNDGASALAALDDFQPDTILLDVGMPGMSGYELARHIRARADGSRFTLIAITGWAQEEERRRSREAGIDHHLVKPVDLAVLERLLR